MIKQEKQEILAAAAAEVRRKAHAPYSHFCVGAALLAEDGDIITGINMESSSYGLSVCAERNTLATAVAQGKKQFKAMAVSSRGGVTPCGACRQVIYDMCGRIDIILADEEGRIKKITDSKKLLPDAFGDKDLE
ncbi:MAG: cytidine deaminase [FCB group bacterium]|nr:cytidine deaminase [FCB group bacterium]